MGAQRHGVWLPLKPTPARPRQVVLSARPKQHMLAQQLPQQPERRPKQQMLAQALAKQVLAKDGPCGAF